VNESRFLGLSLSAFALLRNALLIVLLVAVLIVFFGVPLPVSGSSMVPNFQSGELVVVEKISYFSGEIQRGDVVAARFPADPKKTRLIKRVVGLPGEFVEYTDGQFIVDGAALNERYQITPGTPPYQEIAAIQLKQDEYFLVGDNRPGSSDSRLWGPVQRQDIQGRAAFVLFPFGNVRYVDRLN
ncbi:MAG: signal peptidase I, partial [Patescibacteria group bacterium]